MSIHTIINCIMGMIIMLIVPIMCIRTFCELDEDCRDKLKLNKTNIITLMLVAIGYGLVTPLLIPTEFEYINLTLLMAYLVFMSYTDQKTMLLYTAPSIVMFMVELLLLILNYNNLSFDRYTPTVLVVLVALYAMSLFRWIGYGDVLIYTVLIIYLMQYRAVPTMSLLINILLTNILFVVTTLIMKIIKKDKSKHQPLTIFIAISTYLCNIFYV